MKLRKVFRYSVLIFSGILLAGIFLLYFCIEYYLPYSPIRPHRFSNAEMDRFFAGHKTPKDFGLTFSQFDFVVQDSIRLKGWIVFSRKKIAKGTIILLHGIGSCKESWLTFADTLAQNGFNSVIYDSRAHGESGGVNCTFGYYEKYDVQAVMKEVKKKHGNLGQFAILGHSMGAAVALQTMAIDTNIICGVIMSPFATLREIIYDSWKKMSGSPDHIIPDAVLKNSERIAEFRIDSVRPEESAKLINSPVMVVHGDKDEKISITYGKRIYNNLTSKEKQLYVVLNGDHDHLAQIGGTMYYSKILVFLNQNFKN